MQSISKNDTSPLPAAAPDRLVSLDAYRGLSMLLMVSMGFGAWQLLQQPWVADHPQWKDYLLQFNHRDWHGCTLWDLIFPVFLFVIGVAMPFSYRSRSQHGQTWTRQVMHALLRGMILYALGDFIISYHAGELQTNFPVVLQKIGVCYFLAFLILRLHLGLQLGTALLLLVAHTAAYLLYAGDSGDPWARGDNVGRYVQENWFHLPVRSGNTALNAITGTVNVILGILCGRLLQSSRHTLLKISLMLLSGIVIAAAGWALATQIPQPIPINKWLWTSSYTLWTGGITLLGMVVFYCVIDVWHCRFWAFPLVVVGMNSISVYLVAQLLRPQIQKAIVLCIPKSIQNEFAGYPVLLSVLVLLAIWGFAYWLYRHRVFMRV